MEKIGIIGGGISGLTIANLLKKTHDVTIFERKSSAGGLIKCERVRDCLFHKVGGHVFNAKNQTVFNWFWSHFDKDNEFVLAKRNAKVYFNDAIVGYPIENYIYSFETPIFKKILNELMDLQHQNMPSPLEYENFEVFLQKSFGQTLYKMYFEPYNQKIWQTDLSKVAIGWLEGKLPMPNFREIILANILREEETQMVHSSFYYPKEGGSQFIVDRLKKNLRIVNQTLVKNIQQEDDKLIVEGEQFDKLIYCGDIRHLPFFAMQLLYDAGVDVDYIKQLQSNGTSNLFCETDDTDISWLYIPEPFTKAHRIIYTGNFSDTNNRGSNRKTCVVEFSGKVDIDVMKEEIKKLPGNLTPLAYNYEPNSYVIQDHRTRKEIAAAKRVLEQHNIYLLGRFAEWEYYNMDKAIEAAFALKEILIQKKHAVRA